MKIGFGALGEGYAADRCREMMLARGIQAGIVNGSGDMNTWGTNQMVHLGQLVLPIL
jgi:thiamine biosynthesis lipoprotein